MNAQFEDYQNYWLKYVEQAKPTTPPAESAPASPYVLYQGPNALLPPTPTSLEPLRSPLLQNEPYQETETAAAASDSRPDEVAEITYIDLAMIPDAVDTIWQTGRLPTWLLHCRNLEVLKASKLGLLTVDKWLVQLPKLRSLYLDGNQISTWPHHLGVMKTLTIICLDGNPCLEGMFSKSASFRTIFFGNSLHVALSTSRKNEFPPELNGPEWRPGELKRAEMPHLPVGTYCGGIFTLSTPPLIDNHGLLSPLGACPLMDRRLSGKPAPPTRQTGVAVAINATTAGKPSKLVRGSEFILELFDDINILLGDLSSMSEVTLPQSREPSISREFTDYDHLISELGDFILNDGLYMGKLGEVMRLFFRRRIKRSIARKLRMVFDGFPELFKLHKNLCIPLLNDVREKLQRGECIAVEESKDSRGKIMLTSFVAEYQKYGERFVAGSTNLWSWLREGGDDEPNQFSAWLEAQELRPEHTVAHAHEYLMLPLARLNDYLQFFTRLSHSFPMFQKAADIMEKTQRRTNQQIRRTRQAVRQTTLASHYQASREKFLGFKWDALFHVYSRTYLEQGKYEPSTCDVLDDQWAMQRPLSAVKQVFDHGDRLLRLVFRENELQLWDETVKAQIGSITSSNFTAGLEAGDLIRLVFKNVRETCICNLVGFDSVESYSGCANARFLQAVDVMQVTQPEEAAMVDGVHLDMSRMYGLDCSSAESLLDMLETNI